MSSDDNSRRDAAVPGHRLQMVAHTERRSSCTRRGRGSRSSGFGRRTAGSGARAFSDPTSHLRCPLGGATGFSASSPRGGRRRALRCNDASPLCASEGLVGTLVPRFTPPECESSPCRSYSSWHAPAPSHRGPPRRRATETPPKGRRRRPLRRPARLAFASIPRGSRSLPPRARDASAVPHTRFVR